MLKFANETAARSCTALLRSLPVLAVVIGLLIIPAAEGAAPPVGLGVMVGEPTGVSGKLWLGARSAVDMAASWSLVHDGRAEFHGDYLRHNAGLFSVRRGSLALTYGIGGRLLMRKHRDDRLGARIPVGLSYLFEGNQVEVFVEAVPIVDLIPETEGDLAAALGIRYMIR